MTTVQENQTASPQRTAENRQLAHNIVYLTLSMVAVNVSLFVYNWVIIRWYGKSEHGELVWIVALSRLGMLISDLGPSSKSGIRTIAKLRVTEPGKLGDAIGAMSVVQMAFAIIPTILMIALAGPIAGHKSGIDPFAIRLAGTWIAIYAVQKICLMVCMGLERMFIAMIITPLSEIAKMVWVFFCAFCHLGLMWIFVGWTVAFLLCTLAAMPLTRSLTREFALTVRLRVGSIGDSLRMLVRSVPYYISSLGMFGAQFVMQLVVGLFQPDAEVSVLQVCFQLAVMSRLLSQPIASAMFPRFARIDPRSPSAHAETAALLGPSIRLLGLVGTLVFASYWAVGPFILAKVYQGSYSTAMPTLLLLTLALTVENYTQQLDQVLMAQSHVGIVAWMEGVKYIVMGAASLWLAPRYGAYGAAWAVAISIFSSIFLKMILAKRAVKSIGALPFGVSLVVFGVVAAVGCLGFWGKVLVLPAWMAAALALGMLNPKELRRWMDNALSVGRREA